MPNGTSATDSKHRALYSTLTGCIAGIPRRRHRYRHGHPREDVGEDVGVGVRVRVGVVECWLMYTPRHNVQMLLLN